MVKNKLITVASMNVWCVQCVEEFVDVSCDFEHPFACGYTDTVAGTFSWERTDATGLRYMQNSRDGKLMLLCWILFCYLSCVILMMRPLSSQCFMWTMFISLTHLCLCTASRAFNKLIYLLTYSLPLPSRPTVYNIWAVMIVWRKGRKIIITFLCCRLLCAAIVHNE